MWLVLWISSQVDTTSITTLSHTTTLSRGCGMIQFLEIWYKITKRTVVAGIVDFFPSGPHHHKHHHTFPHQHHHKRERRTCEPDEVCGIDFCIYCLTK